MTNPFENPDGVYLVLVNDENQHSLWPSFAEVPAGLDRRPRPASRGSPAWTTSSSNWTDMRPKSLIEAMDG